MRKKTRSRNTVMVALAGVGNCASSFVQGIEYYSQNQSVKQGIMHSIIGGYLPDSVRFVAAFDIDVRKVGRDLSEAIFAEPNTARRIIDVKRTGVTVQMAQPLDGATGIAGEKVQVSRDRPANITKALEDADVDVLVNLTPTGASKASEMYAQAALRSGCAYVNATPAKIASSPKWFGAYKRRKLLLVGDDAMDQVGSTVLHRNLLAFLNERGAHLTESYQLDIGGGTESKTALDKKKYEIKRNIKTAAVASVVPYGFPIVAGSSDFVDFMGNRRTSYFWVRGDYYAGGEFNMDLRLTLEDGPACAGILTDIVRMVKHAVDRGFDPEEVGKAVSAYGFKAPPKRIPFQQIPQQLDRFFPVEGRKA